MHAGEMWINVHASERDKHNYACTFLYLSIDFNSAEFGDDEDNESPMYTHNDFLSSEAKCACMRAHCA